MATERDFELLDDYVANRLGGAEKSAFEKKIQADPELQREHLMQEKMVNAIKEARVSELKAILNNVTVPPINHGGTSVVAKLAVGTFVAGLVATGIYFYFDKPEEVSQPIEQSGPIEEDKVQNLKSEEKSAATESAASDANVNEPVPASERNDATGDDETSTVSKQPIVDVYDPTAEEATADVEEPAAERRNSARAGAPSIAVQVDKQNKKYDFDYQFKGGKLQLYGPFEKNLYEILEFFSDEKRTVFLYYKGNYYLLRDDNEEVKELTPIKDQTLIKKLKEYRGN
jgi:hypothetical protein